MPQPHINTATNTHSSSPPINLERKGSEISNEYNLSAGNNKPKLRTHLHGFQY